MGNQSEAQVVRTIHFENVGGGFDLSTSVRSKPTLIVVSFKRHLPLIRLKLDVETLSCVFLKSSFTVIDVVRLLKLLLPSFSFLMLP